MVWYPWVRTPGINLRDSCWNVLSHSSYTYACTQNCLKLSELLIITFQICASCMHVLCHSSIASVSLSTDVLLIGVVVSGKSVDTDSESAQELVVRAVHLTSLHYFWRFSLWCHSASNSTDCAANSYPGRCLSTAVGRFSSVWLLRCPRGHFYISLLLK